MSSRVSASVGILVLLAALGASATTYHVNADGSGDFETIQVAIDASADGDVVLLADGVFTGEGNRDIDFLGKAITVRSLSGSPEDCVIDCYWFAHGWSRGFVFQSGEGHDSVLDGVTIENAVCSDEASSRCGGGIMCSSSPTISNCIIQDCLVGGKGGGIMCSGASCAPTISGCIIRGNTAEDTNVAWAYGGGVCCFNDAAPVFNNCWIVENHSEWCGGGVFTYYANPTFAGCLIAGNSCPPGHEGAIRAGTSALFRNCTIVDHWGSQPSITIGAGADIRFENSVIAFNRVAFGEWLMPDVVTLSCCDVFGNEEGDWVHELAPQLGVRGNICLDPLFCDVASGDYQVQEDSPCAPHSPPNPSCALMGAFGVGCPGSSVVEPLSWGSIKALYRL